MLTTVDWKPDYDAHIRWRLGQLQKFRADPELLKLAHRFYSTRPVQFINDWVDTIDPRNVAINGRSRMPFLLFPQQVQLVNFFEACLAAQTSGLVEKSRDMGATWVGCAYSVWLWLYKPNVSVGWGSRKAELVDRIGDPDSIFEKMRRLISALPVEFRPSRWEASRMKFVNHENGATITGEGGDDIGRGGRKTLYLVDEAAHLEHPETVEASLSENTRVRIDISSVCGIGGVFQRRRESGTDWLPHMPMSRDKTYVFIMDWRDHPFKTKEWYEDRRTKFESEGLLHIFKQEVDRDYAASQVGGIIQREWIQAAIDAHKKIPGMTLGNYVAGLDVADGGGDKNALVRRKGVTLESAEVWGERDTGVTARRAVAAVSKFLPCDVMYDCVGVGSGVKAEINRLKDDKLLDPKVRFYPWDAGASPANPDDYVVQGDASSSLNKDHYMNLKAQGWWELRRRFEKTYRVVVQGERYPVDELISISSDLDLLRQAEKELLQATSSLSSTMRLLVNKTPEGARSPNIADAIMMCYHAEREYMYDPTRWS